MNLENFSLSEDKIKKNLNESTNNECMKQLKKLKQEEIN
jgi:hypothetical protein